MQSPTPDAIVPVLDGVELPLVLGALDADTEGEAEAELLGVPVL